jgi:hypothetical protein
MKSAAALMVLALASTARADSDEPESKTIVITEKGSPFWAGVAVTTGVVSLGLLATGTYYNASWRGDVDSVRVQKPDDGPVTEADCGRTDIVDMGGTFGELCKRRDRARTLLVAGLLTVPVVAISAYFGFFRVSKRELRTIALVPTVTTETAGLTLDVRW